MTHNRAVSLHPSTTSADCLKNWRSDEIQMPLSTRFTPSCLSNHHKRADTRALQQIKALSIVRLISLALLPIVSVTACSSGKANPRAMGIGLRSGAIYSIIPKLKDATAKNILTKAKP